MRIRRYFVPPKKFKLRVHTEGLGYGHGRGYGCMSGRGTATGESMKEGCSMGNCGADGRCDMRRSEIDTTCCDAAGYGRRIHAQRWTIGTQ